MNLDDAKRRQLERNIMKFIELGVWTNGQSTLLNDSGDHIYFQWETKGFSPGIRFIIFEKIDSTSQRSFSMYINREKATIEKLDSSCRYTDTSILEKINENILLRATILNQQLTQALYG